MRAGAERVKGMVAVLAGFGRALRARGLAVGPGDVVTYCAAAATLDPTDLADLYWTGRATLVSRRADLAVFDEVFHEYYLGGTRPVDELLRLTAQVSAEAESSLEVPLVDDPGGEADDEQATMGLVASAADVLRHRAFADCTPDELRAVRRITARLRLDPPRR
ncbi:MAG TPA: CoxE, partial [Pseudonocardia sp.]|nr:CoxE [Pseudonocardia sp.]